MPYILCPDCNKKNLAKLPGDFNRETWAQTYGDKPAPITCFDANLWNDCVRKREAKIKADKEAKSEEVYQARRELALSIDEVKLLLAVVGGLTTDPKIIALDDKLEKFLAGDDEFLVLRPE